MAEVRPNRWEVLAWSLLASGLLVAGCVLSHDPTAPTPQTAYPVPPPSTNLLGPPGVWLAENLVAALGNTVYLLLAAWFVLVLMLLLQRGLWKWSLRLVGWLLLLPAAAVLLDLMNLEAPGYARAGAGGSVGAWLALWLEKECATLGRTCLLAGALLVGFVLAFDFAVWHGLRWLFQAVQWCRGRWPVGKKKRSVSPPRRQVPTTSAPVRPETTPPVRRPLPQPAAEKKAISEVPISRPQPLPTEPLPQDYELPAIALLDEPEPFPYEQHDQELRERALQLEKIFKDFELNVRVVGINTGPVVTQFELALETGLRVQKVTCMADDIALNMGVTNVRMVAPIPGKKTVGVEIPNEHRAMVRLKEVILTAAKKAAKQQIPLFLGKDTEGRPLVQDLAEMPHLLIAGCTGTGKSVCLNAVILSILMTRRPDEVKLIMLDPKRTEMSEYGKVPHLMSPVVIDHKKAEAVLAWAVDKMEERYDLLNRARVRNITSYNELGHEEILRRVKPTDEDRDSIPAKMPYIVILVDELADLMMTMKREIESHIIRLAQKSRAAGIHLVVATQKPTVDVITGLIKSNLPARVCFKVSSRSDSRVVLDEMGSEKLLGKGDMLFLVPGTSILVRAQGTYATDREITRVVESLECEPEYSQELLTLKTSDSTGEPGTMAAIRGRDECYEQAIEIVIREGRGSVSLLQRTLGIGYGRAARLIDFMAEDGLVGAYNGSNAREVLMTPEEWEQMKVGSAS